MSFSTAVQSKLDKLLTFQPDKQKHLNGAFIASWVIVICYMFGGKTTAIIPMILGILLAIVWEFRTKVFSFLDIAAFIVGITPVSILILIN